MTTTLNVTPEKEWLGGIGRLRSTFQSGKSRTVAWRKQQLNGLKRFISENKNEIVECIITDLGRCEFEAVAVEVEPVLSDIRFALKNIDEWTKPVPTPTPALLQPSMSEYIHEPFGVCLIIGPFNYPLSLMIGPLIGAISAGNCCVLKPSELTSRTERLLQEKLLRYLDPDCFQVVCGDSSTSSALLAQRWDHIFFTGSTRVGKIVLRAAAEHLTPCVLELGGKSPTVIDDSAVDLQLAANRILSGKCINMGQTCISPDYVFCHEKHYDRFLEVLKTTLLSFYSADPRSSPDLARMVSVAHTKRIASLISGGGDVFCGGLVDVDDKFVSPTIMINLPADAKVLQEEIFGPVLPVMKYREVREVVSFVHSGEKPLALYIFSKNRAFVDELMAQVQSGSVVVNDTVFQFLNPYLPFGGVGHSGMGAYKGKFGFECFSHRRAVLRKDDHAALDVPIRYPPYSPFSLKCLIAITRIPFAIPFVSKRALLLSLALSLALLSGALTYATGSGSDDHGAVVSNDHGDGHGHGHGSAPAPTKVPQWICDLVEPVFKVQKRKSTIEMEIYTGVVQFISCLYVLPVVPFQMKRAGYDQEGTIMATAVTCCIGCIIGAFLTDMPFIIAPPTSVSIFFAVSLQQKDMGFMEGNTALMVSSAILCLVGLVPAFGRLLSRLIPDSIQAATSVGVGLMTALAGATEIHMVVQGKYTILDMGELTLEVVIAMAALVIVAVMLHFHVKGAFCAGLMFGTIVWWAATGEIPEAAVKAPALIMEEGYIHPDVVLLIFNLFFLYFIFLNGVARSMSDLGGLTKKGGVIPRGNMLFIVCGLTSLLSGYFSGPPILISPETAAGIKAGAKTGLSTLVCGVLFGVSTFFSPIFAAVPAAGTAPLLIMVGVMMFGSCKRIDWTDYKVAVPAYCVLFYIPFTYSILRGVVVGYVIYMSVGLYTGDLLENLLLFRKDFWTILCPARKPSRPLSDLEDLPSHGSLSSLDDHEKPTTTIGRIRKMLDDSMELQADHITKIDNI